MIDTHAYQLKVIAKELEKINQTLMKTNTLLYELVRPKPKKDEDAPVS